MKTLTLALLAAVSLFGQSPDSRPFRASLELDAFYGNWGAVYYPRVKWQATTAIGKFSGFGFVYRDRLPGPWFANHPLTFTPKPLPWFSVRTETGGVPTGYFFQIGPQANLQAIKPVGRQMRYLVVSYLPKLGGIRINNWLVAGSTRDFKLAPKLKFYGEFYERFFPERGIKIGRYGEAWGWFKPAQTPRLQFGVLVRQNKDTWMCAGGFRFFL